MRLARVVRVVTGAGAKEGGKRGKVAQPPRADKLPYLLPKAFSSGTVRTLSPESMLCDPTLDQVRSQFQSGSGH
eukprot:CAMPEP_0204154952 /NCGR_PEP_ID=MMETSP0361-20130328/29175_1 /ASSEMBLY_ACC=CAM_ASM_000343 /TAXON_ID=268821 /ORGANISM="Scrippsiella Hangoei, Strain SHTV-5" /LENGTH=73 /DNA_ID=CAMNT_0051110317 /DNA_START=69 /DNA_END=287 /DNA_ORIENTATION=-